MPAVARSLLRLLTLTHSLTFTSICLVDRSFLLAHWAGWAGKPNGLVRLKSAVRPQWLAGPSRLEGGLERRRSRRPAISVMAENGVSPHDSRHLFSPLTNQYPIAVSLIDLCHSLLFGPALGLLFGSSEAACAPLQSEKMSYGRARAVSVSHSSLINVN